MVPLQLKNIDHTFDVEHGDVGVTIRVGAKWRDVPKDTLMDLYNCHEGHSGNCTLHGCRFCGTAVKVGEWYGALKDLPPALLAMEHNIQARDPEVLLRMLKAGYGDGVTGDTAITALIYQRVTVVSTEEAEQ